MTGWCIFTSILVKRTDTYVVFVLMIELQDSDSQVVVKEKSVSVILLAGGKGKRMGVSYYYFLLFFLSLNSCLILWYVLFIYDFAMNP